MGRKNEIFVYMLNISVGYVARIVRDSFDYVPDIILYIPNIF